MQYIYYTLFIASFVFLLVRKKGFIIYLPLLNVILDSAFSVFESLSFLTFLRPLAYLILFFYYRNVLFRLRIFRPIYIFMAYTLCLVFFSSELFVSFKGYMQSFISIFMIVIGFEYISNEKRLKELNGTLVIVIMFSVVASIIGYTFDIGRVLEYTRIGDTEEQIVGLLGSSGLYSATFAISILPLILYFINNKLWRIMIIAVAIICYIFILLNVRRTVILIPVVGYLTYLLFMPRKMKFISGLIGATVIILLLSPIYSDMLISRLEIREEQGRFERDFIRTEGRYIETVGVVKNTFSFSNPINSLFGENIYASGWENRERSSRMLHTDISVLLHDTGLIGFLIYFLIYIRILKLVHLRKNVYSDRVKIFRAILLSLIMVSIFASLNGSILLVSLRSLIFLYFGALLRLTLSYQPVTRVQMRPAPFQKRPLISNIGVV